MKRILAYIIISSIMFTFLAACNEVSNIEEGSENRIVEEFNIYSMDANTEEKIVIDTISLSQNLSLEEKLTIIASALSEKVFSDLPIKLVELKEADGKKIAVFNFDELGNNQITNNYSSYKGISWFSNYFQGSTGGRITEYTLEETLLQRNYSGEWIEGVEFTYKNGPVDFQHVEGLTRTIFR